MKVVQIIESLRPGGKERQLVELIRGLSRLRPNFEHHLLVMSDDIHYDLSDLPNVCVEKLVRTSRRDPAFFARMFRTIAGIKPDIVHSWGSMCSVFAAPATTLMRLPFINGIVRDAPPNLGMSDPDYRRARLTFPISTAVVGNSRAGLRVYRAPHGRSHCIHNGFDMGRIQALADPAGVRARLSIETPHVVGMVASYTERKDHDSFFEAARRVLAQRDDVTFVTLGDGEKLEHYRRQFLGGAHPRVRILDRQVDVESVINVFTIGVLTTNTATHGEGISNSIMEYMALGKPALATDAGGSAEIVREGQNGYLLRERDPDQLSGLLLSLLDDPELRAELGRAGSSLIQREFSIEAMVGAYDELYSSVVSKGGA